MAIVSSQLTLGVVQKDGRRYVLETHTDNLGVLHVVEYLAAVGADVDAILTARAVLIEADLEQIEVKQALDTDASPTLQYATMVQLGNYVRSHYRDMSGLELARTARWIVNRINDGTFTDTQVRNFFGLTLTQYNTLKTKWQTLKSEYDDIFASVGE